MELGFGYDIDREFQYVPAEIVREHLELTREIQLLTAIVQGGQKQPPVALVQHLTSRAKTVRISALKLTAIDAMNPSERSRALLREI
jgi:chemotaxis response regulator CheB